MSKKKLFFIITLLFAVSFIGGACGYFGIAYIKAGGTAEGALDYIENTVIPEIFPAGVFIITLYIASKPLTNKVQGIISKFFGAIGTFEIANKNVESVKDNGKESIVALNKAMDELNLINSALKNEALEFKDLLTSQMSELKSAIVDNNNRYERIKKGLEIAFTSNAELVRDGYARRIYNALEGVDEDEGAGGKR